MSLLTSRHPLTSSLQPCASSPRDLARSTELSALMAYKSTATFSHPAPWSDYSLTRFTATRRSGEIHLVSFRVLYRRASSPS